MKDFEKVIGYRFNDQSLLLEALTHSSYANEHRSMGINCNERLEFLGDAVLSVVVADYIYNNLPNYPEGKLTQLRANLVCEKKLFKFAKAINLGDYLFLSKGEKNNKGAERPSILSDAFEAIIAAIYLDGGMECASDYILKFIVPEIKSQSKAAIKDYKTTLQEIIQKNPEERLSYVMVSEHDKHFVFEVRLNSNAIGRGGGRSKKEAEQNAAREALELMGY